METQAQQEKRSNTNRSDHKQINWKGVITEKISDEEETSFIFFDNAVFLDPCISIPQYFEREKINNKNVEVKAYLLNPVYIELSDKEAALVSKNAKAIMNDIVPETRISFERKSPFVNITFIPIRKNGSTGKFEKLISFDLKLVEKETSSTKNLNERTYASNSVLATGDWYKIGVTADGVYKISFSDLNSLGINPTQIDPGNIKIYGNGGGLLPESNGKFRHDDLVENAIWFEDNNGDGVFNSDDYILFYGQSSVRWKYDTTSHHFHHLTNYYSDMTYYFITVGSSSGKRLVVQPSTSLPATDIITQFDDYACHERDSVNLITSGREWYGEYFDIITSHSFAFDFPYIVNGADVYLKVTAAARNTIGYTSMGVGANGHNYQFSIGPVSGGNDFARDDSFLEVAYPANSSSIDLTVTKQTSSSLAWMNYVELNVKRLLNFTGHQTIFRSVASVGVGKIAEFTLSNGSSVSQIWDVTNPVDVKKQDFTSGSNVVFRLPTDTLKEFIAFNGSDFYSPLFIGKVANQNLHSLPQADLIIISYPDFIGEAERLADLHRTFDTMRVVVVTPQQIYNEFSSGEQDASAIRDFVKMFYDRALTDTLKLPKYVLMFGDGSYDYKDRMPQNTNFVPTYESLTSLDYASSWVTDDFFGCLDDSEGNGYDDDMDVGIGRFPVKNTTEAKNAVDKVIRYLSQNNLISSGSNCSLYNNTISNLADWRNWVCFIADDEDGNTHISQANQMATYVDTTYNDYNIDKIYFDAYQEQSTPGGQRYPDVTAAINKRVEKGALIINYTGHGGELGWAHERVLEIYDINNWDNTYNMPVFVTATCEFSRFDDPERTSAGEYVFLNPNGGGISLFTTTRLSYSSFNFTLNMNFYRYVFNKIDGKYPKMGDNIRNSKVASGSNTSIRNFVLLGDPALGLAYPKYDVVTTSCPDTMKALSKVTVTGYVTNAFGLLNSNFNGILYPTVFDKKQNVTTLANDPGSSPFTFNLQKNIIYKGKASVKKGLFSFSFMVPKDIAYNYGIGRISYYAENDTIDANGFYESVIIGGSETNINADNIGPDIKLYLNDLKFVFGGTTDENPLLLSLVADSNGINTVGNGIGHDIVATLDENTEKAVVLNDYYEADLDNYKSGKIKYPFYDLDEGSHTLRLKVWDVYNNSSEVYTEFVVAQSAQLALNHVFNYPNPFTTHTSFCFEHNQPCCDLDIQIQIFTITGKLIKTIDDNIQTIGFRVEPEQIVWDGRDDFGDPIGQGVYIYKLRVKGNEGTYAQIMQKLVILK